jgi:hypothetical protein
MPTLLKFIKFLFAKINYFLQKTKNSYKVYYLQKVDRNYLKKLQIYFYLYEMTTGF